MLHEVELVYRKTYDEDDPVMLKCFSILAKFVQEMNYQSKGKFIYYDKGGGGDEDIDGGLRKFLDTRRGGL